MALTLNFLPYKYFSAQVTFYHSHHFQQLAVLLCEHLTLILFPLIHQYIDGDCNVQRMCMPIPNSSKDIGQT